MHAVKPGTGLRKPLHTRPDGRIVVRRGVVLGPGPEPGTVLVLWWRRGGRVVVVE